MLRDKSSHSFLGLQSLTTGLVGLTLEGDNKEGLIFQCYKKNNIQKLIDV